jgi:hypothetical protein
MTITEVAITFAAGWITARHVDPLLTRLWQKIIDPRGLRFWRDVLGKRDPS